jgi:uncharacterized Rmd1/YagE family protein
MRCLSISCDYSFDMESLLRLLETHGAISKYGDVVHVLYANNAADVFFFPYGVIVSWGLDKEDEKKILASVKKAKGESLGSSSRDSLEFEYGKYPSIKDDYIVLPDKEVLTKLACSHALAQSIKLAGFESIIQKTTRTTRDILKTLSTKGKIPLSRKDIRHLMGKILLDRNSINLHLELLYTPKFFWSNSDLEPLYQMTTTYVDLHDRVSNLNHRLEVMHELFNMLAAELNYQHSASLEWIIILLITFEVIMTLSKDFFHWF